MQQTEHGEWKPGQDQLDSMLQSLEASMSERFGQDKELQTIIDNMKTVNRHFEVDSNVNQKKCNNCKIEKSVKYFYTDSTSQDNYHNRCKSCNDSIQKIIN